MKNRYGVEYNFARITENRFQFVMDEKGMKYCRFGGKEGQDSLDLNDLGFFDPSGGPFVACGGMIFPDETNDESGPWTVTSIFCADQDIFVEVE
jgi:hypothetical protein